MEAVRWGVLSVSGHYGLRVHGPLSRLPEASLLGIASRDEARARAAAAAWSIPRAYGSYEALLADPDIEAVYLPLPNHLHLPLALAALAAGKHVLCEKPLALTAAEARTMAAAAREGGLLLMEAFMYPFHPQWARARAIVASGELGALRRVDTTFSYHNADPRNIRNQADLGGGALYDIGCYAVSVARFLIGAEPRRALAQVERDPVLGTDILSSGLLDFGPGAPQAGFTVATQAFPRQVVEVLGRSGSLTVVLPFNAYPDVALDLVVRTGLGERRVACGPEDQYGAMFAAFCRAIRGGGPAPRPPEDGVANLAVLDALFASEASGTWAPVAPAAG